MKATKDFCKTVDFIGTELKPSFKGNPIISTVFGGMLSAFAIIISVAALFFFGLELVTRSKPIVRSYTRVESDLAANVDEFPVIFNLWTESGIPILINPMFSHEFKMHGTFVRIQADSQGQSRPVIQYLPAVNCSPEVIGNEAAAKFLSYGFDVRYFICFDFSSVPYEDRVLMKPYGSPGNVTIRSHLELCDSKINLKCGDAFKMFGNLHFTAMFINKFIDISDFSEPVKENLITFEMNVSNSFESTMKVVVNKNMIISDEGWILSSMREEQYTSIAESQRDFGSMNPTSRHLVKFFVDLNLMEVITERQYLKIQELLANLGGFVKAIVLMSTIINKANTDVHLINSINEMEVELLKKRRSQLPVRIRFSNVNEKQADESNTEIRQTTVLQKKMKICGYIRNILCFKLKENTKRKMEAMKYIDLEQLLIMNEKITILEEKFIIGQVN